MFSFNSKLGWCSSCLGTGRKTIAEFYEENDLNPCDDTYVEENSTPQQTVKFVMIVMETELIQYLDSSVSTNRQFLIYRIFLLITCMSGFKLYLLY